MKVEAKAFPPLVIKISPYQNIHHKESPEHQEQQDNNSVSNISDTEETIRTAARGPKGAKNECNAGPAWKPTPNLRVVNNPDCIVNRTQLRSQHDEQPEIDHMDQQSNISTMCSDEDQQGR